jgi:hypothetical protein
MAGGWGERTSSTQWSARSYANSSQFASVAHPGGTEQDPRWASWLLFASSRDHMAWYWLKSGKRRAMRGNSVIFQPIHVCHCQFHCITRGTADGTFPFGGGKLYNTLPDEDILARHAFETASAVIRAGAVPAIARADAVAAADTSASFMLVLLLLIHTSSAPTAAASMWLCVVEL